MLSFTVPIEVDDLMALPNNRTHLPLLLLSFTGFPIALMGPWLALVKVLLLHLSTRIACHTGSDPGPGSGVGYLHWVRQL